MLLEELAKELVPVTSELLGGRTMNIMGTDGIIIASADKSRIGTFHQGAWEAVTTGRMVNISKDQLSRYPGAKEGCNMPLRLNGSIIGAVGIYGDPEEIKYLAKLLEVYAEKYYMLEAISNPDLMEEGEMQRNLFSLLFRNPEGVKRTLMVLKARRVTFEFPLQLVLLSPVNGKPLSRSSVERILKDLSPVLNRSKDLWGVYGGNLVILFGESRDYLSLLPSVAASDLRILVSRPLDEISEIPDAYESMSRLCTYSNKKTVDLNEVSDEVESMLASVCELNENRLRDFREMLKKGMGEMDVILASVDCYYRNNRSIQNASACLGIHKNTLQYRLSRFFDVLGIDRSNSFVGELIARLLVMNNEHETRQSCLD